VDVIRSPSNASACAESIAVEVHCVIGHAAGNIKVHINVELVGATLNERGVFAISKLEVSPLSEPVAEWTRISDVFAGGLRGWQLQNVPSGAITSACGATSVLGGFLIAAKGAVAKKIFTKIPAHSHLIVSFTFYFIANWDSKYAKLNIEGIQVWEKLFSYSQAANLVQCGIASAHMETITLLIEHAASAATLEFATTLNEGSSNEAWAISDILLTPASNVAAGTQGTGFAPWQDNTSNFLHGDLNGWQGTNIEGISCDLRDTPAGLLVSAGFRGLFNTVSKTFTKLPTHTSLAVEFDVFPFHASGEHVITAEIGGSTWRSDAVDHQAAVTSCDEVVAFKVNMPLLHSNENITISFTSTASLDYNSPGFGVFGLANVRISLVDDSGKSQNWTDGVLTDFSEGRDGWLVSNGDHFVQRVTTTCGEFGDVLGGYGVFGFSGFAEKQVINLPQHTMMLVVLDLYYILT